MIRTHYRKHIAFFFLCWGWLQAWGQPSTLLEKEVRFDQLPPELNLGERTINCMVQDQAGHLWMGTWSGLIQYDGYEATLHQASAQAYHLKSNKITCLLAGPEGQLWVGTRQAGLFRYDPVSDQFTQYGMGEEGQQLSNPNVWSLAWGEDSTLWVGTEDGLNHLDLATGTITAYMASAKPDHLLNSYIRAIQYDIHGDLWIGTERGLHRLVEREGTISFDRFIYGTEQRIGDPHNYVYQISCDPDGKTLWFTTKAGLKRLRNDTLTNFMVNPAFPAANHFRSLRVLPGTTPRILTGSESGLALFDPSEERFVRFWGDEANPSGLSHTTIMCTYVDRTEVLWVGTKKGLNRFDTYDKGFVKVPTSAFDESASILTGITGGEQGNYWVSTLGGGVYHAVWNVEGERLAFKAKPWADNAGDYIDFVQTLCMDPKGVLWVGTAGSGVLRVDPADPANAQRFTAFEQYNRGTSPALSGDYVMALAPSADGGMWVGTWGKGLNKIMPDGTLLRYLTPGLVDAPLVTLYEDVHGILWIGTRGRGLYRARFTPQGDMALTNYRSDEAKEGSLNNDFINAIWEDRVGGFWVGTESGLSLFDRRQGVFTPMGLEGTRPIDMVVGMLEDDAGNLWLSNWEGLTQYEPMTDSTRPLHYDRSDRIQGGFFYNNVCYRDSYGRLFFGGANGLNVINPNRIESNPFPAQVSLKSVRVFEEPITELDSVGFAQGEVQLKHYQNTFSFEFTALHFAAPDKNQFAYRLVGYEDHWIYTDADRRFVNYTNLSPDTYRFEVMASNNDGVWGVPQTLTISITPPWWRTPWALVGYMVVAALVLYLFRQFIVMRSDYYNNLELERLKRENLESLNKAKLEFFTNVSHEFRTPLTLIAGPLQALMELGEGSKSVKQHLMTIHQNTQRLLRLVNQLLDFRKVEGGSMTLQVAEGNFVKFAKEIKLSFEPLAEQDKINFTFKASSNVVRAWYDRDQMEKVLYNLISNAFKHTPGGGEIRVNLVETSDVLQVMVSDNGEGIPAEHIEEIFKRFYSVRSEGPQQGTGIGLALAASIVELHHGTLTVESQPGVETTFTLTIPLGREHFTDAVIMPDFQDSEVISGYPELPDGEGLMIEMEGMPEPPALEDRLKLLIVEDNEDVRKYIRSIFYQHYIILEAENGKQGWEVTQEENPDVVISDVMMPVMDGIQFCKKVKSNLDTSHLPLILLTARTSLIFQIEGLETGADDYVTKPFNPKVLALKVRNLLQSREALRRTFSDRETLVVEPKQITLTSMDEVFMEKALQSVEENMDNASYTVQDMTKDVGMSRMQLYRKLKALTGQTANDFIRTLRLKRAAQLIEQDELTIAEVTYRVGFNDLKYFRNCFKKQFGVNPSEYIQFKKGALDLEEEPEEQT